MIVRSVWAAPRRSIEPSRGQTLEAVDGVLARVDSGAVTAGEAIELALNTRLALRNNRARSLPGNMPASVAWRRALVLWQPLSSVGRRRRW